MSITGENSHHDGVLRKCSSVLNVFISGFFNLHSNLGGRLLSVNGKDLHLHQSAGVFEGKFNK